MFLHYEDWIWMTFLRKPAAILPCLLFLALELGCGNQYRPVANPILSHGGQPQNLSLAWVLNYNPVGAGSSTKIDVSGDTNLEVLSFSAGSVYESFQGAVKGAIFVANRDSDSVSEFSLIGTTTVINISLFPGSRPVGLASTDSTTMYVANSGTNSVCPNTGSLSVISTGSLVATSTVCVGVNPGPVVQLPSNNVVSQKVYVANQGDNTISVYTPTTQTITTTITPANGLHQNPVALVASSDGAYVFVVAQGNGTAPGYVDIINTANDTVGGSLQVGLGPTSISLDTVLNRLYVANTAGNSVTVLDATSVTLGVTPPIKILGTTQVGSAPVSVAGLPNGLSFYVANSGSNNVSVVSSSSFLVTGTVPVGTSPVWVATEPSSTKVYAANSGSGNISIIQVSNNTVTVTMPAPQQDPTCDPKVSTCPLQRPLMIITQ
jgi:YVTN family beta-propeller protein